MRLLEKTTLLAVLGPIAPLVGFLACWWGTFAWLPEKMVRNTALSGLAVGLLAAAVFLRGWMRRGFSFSWKAWAGIYLFYAVGTFGFFMGMPVFNLALVLPAGVIVGGRLARQVLEAGQVRRLIHGAQIYTTSVLAALCLCSATLALAYQDTGAELQAMFHLGFRLTRMHLVGLIVFGGSALLLLHWFLLAAVVYRSLRRHQRAERPEFHSGAGAG